MVTEFSMIMTINDKKHTLFFIQDGLLDDSGPFEPSKWVDKWICSMSFAGNNVEGSYGLGRNPLEAIRDLIDRRRYRNLSPHLYFSESTPHA